MAWHPEAGAPPPRLSLAGLSALRWHDHPQNPRILAPTGSPSIEGPSFLPPGQTPDERYHLFAHSTRGIHHHVSDDGVSWERLPGLVARGALHPYLFCEASRYHLIYEQTAHRLPWQPWRSHLEIISSIDLLRWSAPRVILRPGLPWHRANAREGLSHPCLIRVGDRLRLYYSAGAVRPEERGPGAPAFIGVAEAGDPGGPFVPSPRPLLGPDPADPLARQGAGAMRVLAVEDGLVGFQSPVTTSEAGELRSCVRLMGSVDGLRFTPLEDTPIFGPGEGWRRRQVHAPDARFVGGALRLYYSSGEDGGWVGGRSNIGLALGC